MLVGIFGAMLGGCWRGFSGENLKMFAAILENVRGDIRWIFDAVGQNSRKFSSDIFGLWLCNFSDDIVLRFFGQGMQINMHDI